MSGSQPSPGQYYVLMELVSRLQLNAILLHIASLARMLHLMTLPVSKLLSYRGLPRAWKLKAACPRTDICCEGLAVQAADAIICLRSVAAGSPRGGPALAVLSVYSPPWTHLWMSMAAVAAWFTNSFLSLLLLLIPTGQMGDVHVNE